AVTRRDRSAGTSRSGRKGNSPADLSPYLFRHIDELDCEHSACPSRHHETSARLSGTGGAAHRRAPRTHPRAPGDEGKRSGDRSRSCVSRADDRIAVRSRHPVVLSLLQENSRRGETSVCRGQDRRGRRVRPDRVLDGQYQAGAEAMARDRVKVWYDAKGDYLEVLFDQRPGYFRETTNDQVMEKVDAEGNVLGFS